MAGVKGNTQGHYSVRDHSSLEGVASIWWHSPGQPDSIVANIGLPRVPMLWKALGQYMTRTGLDPEAPPAEPGAPAEAEVISLADRRQQDG